MDYKNEFQSDDDFDSSNGFNDQLSNTSGYNSSGQSRMSDTNGLSKAELRKTNKPIMEKRRRARINHCLNELKSLILEAMKKDPARHTKLEKADILEMTVKHLQSVQRQQLNLAIQTDPSVIHKFKTGFVECAEEVTRYVNQLDGVDLTVRQGLMNHLNKCATNLDQIGSMTNFNNGYCGNMSNILATNPISTATITAPASTIFPPLTHDINNNNGTQAPPIQMGGVQLIPSRLPSGELALIVPNGNNSSVLNNNANTGAPFAVWPPTSLVNLPTHLPTVAINHKISSTPSLGEFSLNAQHNMSAFTKPITVLQQNGIPKPNAMQHIKPCPLQNKNHTKHHNMISKTKLFQTQNNFAQNSTTTTSPPLSPISSISSHGDESSILHTSSEYGISRPATPPQEISLVEKQDFSGVFTTPPSSANSSLSSSNSSANLQQQQVSSTSRDMINSRKRSLNSTTDSGDSSDEPSAKKFSNRELGTDDEGSCWRPW